MKILSNLIGGLDKVVPAALKDHDKKLSSKRIFKLGGGGYLIYEGVAFLNKAIETEKSTALYAGIACLVVGAFLAVGLSEKIKGLTVNGKEETKEGWPSAFFRGKEKGSYLTPFFVTTA